MDYSVNAERTYGPGKGIRRGTFMSWRFRKTFKVLPGVRLNLTERGLSATIGAAPFSVNVGPRGVYSNIGIPGTGIWTRERFDDPSGHQATFEPTPPTGLRDPHPAPVADAPNPLRHARLRSAAPAPNR